MAKFTDAAGREWEVRIDLATVPKLREAGFNLSVAMKDAGELRVFDDPDTLGRVLWVLCGAAAEARGLSQEAFAGGFDGPAIFAFREALEVAVTDFSLPPAAATRMREHLPEIRRRAEAEMLRRLDRTLSSSSGSGGNSPASPGSTPAG